MIISRSILLTTACRAIFQCGAHGAAVFRDTLTCTIGMTLHSLRISSLLLQDTLVRQFCRDTRTHSHILLTLYLQTANGKGMIIYEKHFLLVAVVSSELLTLMPAILAYSASFLPCRLPYES